MARMEAGYDLNLEQRQWVSPSLIEANYILSLSRQELEAVINQELDSNPALEVSEEQVCPRCGGVLEGAFCPTCMINHAEQPERESWEDFPETAYQTSVTRDDSDEFDPMTLVGDSVSLRDRIALDLPTLVGGDLRRIAEYLLDSLDERGYVDADMDDVADQFDVDPADVDRRPELSFGRRAREVQSARGMDDRPVLRPGEPVGSAGDRTRGVDPTATRRKLKHRAGPVGDHLEIGIVGGFGAIGIEQPPLRVARERPGALGDDPAGARKDVRANLVRESRHSGSDEHRLGERDLEEPDAAAEAAGAAGDLSRRGPGRGLVPEPGSGLESRNQASGCFVVSHRFAVIPAGIVARPACSR